MEPFRDERGNRENQRNPDERGGGESFFAIRKPGRGEDRQREKVRADPERAERLAPWEKAVKDERSSRYQRGKTAAQYRRFLFQRRDQSGVPDQEKYEERPEEKRGADREEQLRDRKSVV